MRGDPGTPGIVEGWDVLLVVAPLVFFGIVAVYLMMRWAAPTAVRRRPPGSRDAKIISAHVSSGRAGPSRVWSVTSDPNEYAKIWSEDR